jgi:hypothetical protein
MRPLTADRYLHFENVLYSTGSVRSASVYRLLNLYANEKQGSLSFCLSFTLSITKHVSADVNEMLHDALASHFGITLE